ncbi:abortive phage infection protein, partial [Enterococcus faecalis]|nr:abortive phage infection protein [Enterococcus faecalis]
EMPTQAYSGKATVFKDIKKDLDNKTNYYNNLSSLLPDLVRLYDYIELDFKNKYLEYNPSGKFGALRGIEKKKDGKKPLKTLFLENDTDYKVASGYILPVFGAFRVLVQKESQNLNWRIDPIQMWNKIGASLIKNTFESSRNNPQDAGKNASIWSNNYSKVENEMFRQMLENK